MNVFENCGRCFGASFGDCEDCMKRREERNKMSDYIKKSEAIQTIAKVDDYGDGMCFEVKSHAMRDIELIPSADVVERKSGEWIAEYAPIKRGGYVGFTQVGWSCSRCGTYSEIKHDFCHCGADMRGKDDDN